MNSGFHAGEDGGGSYGESGAGKVLLWMVLLLGLVGSGCQREEREREASLRLGYFPNLTHAQAIVAREMARQGNPWFEPRVGVPVEWFSYNAGPSAMEGLLTGAIDASYVGPNPALNAYIRSGGRDVRVLAGAARGGAALVIHTDAEISRPEDFQGKRIATPQFGNTQDVACRYWLGEHGVRVTLTGGDAEVVPTAHTDMLQLFRRGRLDAVWTVEPWVSRLEVEANGEIFLLEEEAITTLLVSSVRFSTTHEEMAKRLSEAHRELTRWMTQHPEESKELFQRGFMAQTGSRLPDAVIDRAWERIRFTEELRRQELEQFVQRARQVGFLKDAISLDALMEDLDNGARRFDQAGTVQDSD